MARSRAVAARMRGALLFVLALGLLPVSAALAISFDMRVGSGGGTWCGYKARFDIESQEAGTWIFHGHILIRDTGEYDPLWIEQYADNSLRVIRYLQGANNGLTQTVQTYPPREVVSRTGSSSWILFEAAAVYGHGCDPASITGIALY